MIEKHRRTLDRRLAFLTQELQRIHLPGRSFTESERAALSEVLAETKRLDTFQPELRKVLDTRDEQDTYAEFENFTITDFIAEIQELASVTPRINQGANAQAFDVTVEIFVKIAATALAASRLANQLRPGTRETEKGGR